MVDASKISPKGNSSYHFTSTVQDMINADSIQTAILNTVIMLPLRELLGISPNLQKQFSSLTKTHREYASKAIAVEVSASEDPSADMENSQNALSCEWDLNYEHYNTTDNEEVLDDHILSSSEIQLSYDTETEDVNDVLLRYSSAINLSPNPLFAMATGRFRGILADITVMFMVDSGSELNLISEGLFQETSLPLDIDGACWSLRGINGGAVPLKGCCRDVPIILGSH